MANNNNETLFSKDEFLKFPDQTKSKLARFLSEGHFDPGVSFHEVKLLRRAAGRLRYVSLDSACTELEQSFDSTSTCTESKQPCSTDLGQIFDNPRFGLEPPVAMGKDSGAEQACKTLIEASNPVSGGTSCSSDAYKQLYIVVFVKDQRNKPKTVVYDVMRGNYYIAPITKRAVSGSRSACGFIQNDSPYIIMRTCLNKRKKLLTYDLILNKWKTISKSGKDHLQPYLVEINNNVYMFGGKSQDIRKFSSSKWRPAAALIEPIFNPIYIVINEKLTIFDGRSIHVFDSSTNKVRKFDSFTLPAGVAVNINDHACVLTPTSIVRFDESAETCIPQSLNTTLMAEDVLVGAIVHKRNIYIVTQSQSLRVCTLSLDSLNITSVCTSKNVELPRDVSVLTSCAIHLDTDYVISPFLDFEEERKRRMFKR